ncbi:MAG: hypothetical protein NVSMB64_28570 [Candidatus Velthaea sp.]
MPLTDTSEVIGTLNNGTASQPSSTNATIDNLACTPGSSTGQHFHAHLSLFVNGTQYAIPAAIGLYHAVVKTPPNFYDLDPHDATACLYVTHTHVPDGIIHIETANATQTYTLAQFLDVWGVTLSTNGFWTFTGPTRVFVTDENTKTAGTHTVTEITGQNPSTIVLGKHQEYTIEVGTPVNTPNYTFIGGL